MPRFLALLLSVLLLGPTISAEACTNLLVSKGASEDGSTIITYTCDGEFHPRLEYRPAEDFEPGSTLEIRHWDGSIDGVIPQVEHAYAVVGLMNEHQLAIGETTFDGRMELQNPDGMMHYWTLMRLALRRARTAREAIEVITDLVAEHGYRSTGESFSIADPEEAWILEMIGPGPGGEGALWVAMRVPDGMISAHANKARIGEFPMNDPENCLYDPRVIDFAVEQGWHDPTAGVPFRFHEAYCPTTPQGLRYTATRVWSLFRRAAPSQEWPPDYHRGVTDAEPYPLCIEPDEKLSLADVFALMRDHYEGTPYDMQKGVDAGPYGSPNRYQPMGWELDGGKYTWERPISTKKTGFSFVSQSRSWMPDAVGGVYWYGVDDTYTTCYVPLYAGIDAVPESFATGSLQRFSWDSAWWAFNLVANYANLMFSRMIVDIQAVQSELEAGLIANQGAVEQAALTLHQEDPEAAIRYLSDYSVSQGERVVERWRELGEFLITKYNDGYVKDENGRPTEVGYPESWRRDVVKLRPEQFKLPEAQTDTLATELPY